jgi:bifunctional nuclease
MTTATAAGYVEMRIAKAVGLAATEHELFQYVVLEEVTGDRHLAIEIGWAEAVSLAAHLDGKHWPRPMTYQFVAALVQALGGWVRQVRIDRVVEGLCRHRRGGRPAWRASGGRAAQRRAEPGRAGAGTDLRRPQGAAGGRGQTPGGFF